MQTVKRWFKNIKWLLNHPPTGITRILPPDAHCFWCGCRDGLISFTYTTPGFSICPACIKLALERALWMLTPAEQRDEVI